MLNGCSLLFEPFRSNRSEQHASVRTHFPKVEAANRYAGVGRACCESGASGGHLVCDKMRLACRDSGIRRAKQPRFGKGWE